jgi:hypothetical protein
MTHSKQALQVIEACDFPEDCYPWIEELCCKHTPKQIISVIWSKDKGGDHSWQWFVPIFNGKYIPISNTQVEVEMDKDFWEAYDLICQFVEPFHIFDLPLIDRMKGDLGRIQSAISRSKPNIRYLCKVWEDTEKVEYRRGAEEIQRHEVDTIEFD